MHRTGIVHGMLISDITSSTRVYHLKCKCNLYIVLSLVVVNVAGYFRHHCLPESLRLLN